MDFDPQTLETIRWVVALAVPLVVGLISKSSASSGLKSTLNVVLVALATGVTTVLSDANADVNSVVRDFIETAVISFATYYGLWKPTGVAGTVAAKTPRFGFGPDPSLTTEDKGLEEVVVEPEVMESAVDSDRVEEKAALVARATSVLGEEDIPSVEEPISESDVVVAPTPRPRKAPAKKTAAKKATPVKKAAKRT